MIQKALTAFSIQIFSAFSCSAFDLLPVVLNWRMSTGWHSVGMQLTRYHSLNWHYCSHVWALHTNPKGGARQQKLIYTLVLWITSYWALLYFFSFFYPNKNLTIKMIWKRLSPYCGFEINKSCFYCSNQSSCGLSAWCYAFYYGGFTEADHNFNKQIRVRFHQIWFL